MFLLNSFWSGAGSGTDTTGLSENGGEFPFYGIATYPASFYDSTGERTWLAFEGFDGGVRVVYVQTYDHANSRWEKRYEVSRDTLTGDAHGVPAICMDHEGYVHCFFGAHNTAMKHSVTQASRDPSGWDARTDIDTDATYPHPALVGSTLYLFLRRDSAQDWARYKTTSLSGGAATWGAVQTLADFSGGRFYLGSHIVDGTDIHFAACYANSGDTARSNVYHFVYDTTDDSIKNSTASVSTATGSQPISKATADSSYRIASPAKTTLPPMAITPDGTIHVAYLANASTPYDVKYMNFTGSWSSPVTVASIPGSSEGTGNIEEITLVALPNNDVDLYYPDDTRDAMPGGGDILRKRRESGTWGTAETIIEADTVGVGHPTAVLNADGDIRVFFEEISAGGSGRIWGYGDNGFVPGTAPQFLSGPTITQPDGFYGTGDTLTASNLHSGTSETYQWKRDGVAISGATSTTYVLTVTDEGTDITVTVAATNHVGTTATTSAAVSAVAPAYATEDRTLSDTSDRTLSDTSTRTISNRTA